QIIIPHSAVDANARTNRLAVRPFGLDRGDSKKQRAGKISGPADPRFGDGLFDGGFRKTFGERSRAERLDRNEIDGATDRRAQRVGRKPGDAPYPGLPGSEFSPVVGFAGSQRS